MRKGMASAALVAGCWLGTLWPALVLLLVAGWRTRRGRSGGLLLLLALLYLYAVLQLNIQLSQRLPGELEGQTRVVSGQIVTLPRVDQVGQPGRRRQRQTFILQVDQGPPAWPGPHRIKMGAYGAMPLFQAGATVTLAVRLHAPRGWYNATGGDRQRRYLAQRLDARGVVTEVISLGRGRGLVHWRESLSAYLQQKLGLSPLARQVLPALVVGDRSGLERSLYERFQRTGGAHLLAISGLHVAIVAGWAGWLGRWLVAPLLQWLLPFLRRFSMQQIAWCPALLAALGYAAMAGFSLPTVRAVVMLSVVAVAHWCRQPLSLWQSLLCALLAVLVVDPLAALSTSLWLSFTAVAVIATLARAHPSWRLMVLLPVAMMVLSAVLFQQWNATAPLANLVLVPLYAGLIIPFALLAALLDWQSLLLMAATGVEASVLVMSVLSEWQAGWYWPLPSPLNGMLALLALLLLLLPALPLPRRLLPLLLLPWATQSPPPLAPGDLEVTVFDVGQGLAVAVRTHQHLLIYDTGPGWSGGSAAAYLLRPWLARNGLTPDKIIVSHGDLDHAGGLKALSGAVPVSSGEPERVPGSMPCRAGQQWQWDAVSFRLLWPSDPASVSGNSASCVLWVGSVPGEGGVLLTGDAPKQMEYRLLGRLPQSPLLLLGHHGSNTSTSAALLRRAQPQWAVASAGYGNPFHHPHPVVMARLRDAQVTLLRTDHHGMIVFRWYGADNAPLIKKWRQAHARPWHGPVRWRLW